MKCILGTKIGMTQVFKNDGTVVPVTRVQSGLCTVTQVKTQAKDGVNAIQVGFGTQKSFRLNKAEQGHLKGLASVRFLQDFKGDTQELKRGDQFGVNVFAVGDKVQVAGTSKGKGFQGVVKRHGFHGAPATHGRKHDLRMPGSIGAGGVQRVFKGMRMAGHMGMDQVTVKNLEIVEILPETNEILIKGAIPGARGSLVAISTEEGKIEIEMPVSAEVATEATVVETTPVVEDTSTSETSNA
jgi:large subunit ribosomal protein L3